MKYEIKFTSHFKKDYKLAQKRGLDLSALDHVIEEIAEGHPPPPPQTKITCCKGITMVVENATFIRIGFSSTRYLTAF